MRFASSTAALALTLCMASAAGAQTTSRPTGQENMKTPETAAAQVETATFALG